MATYILTWNPRVWKWHSFETDYQNVRAVGYLDFQWSCGATRRIKEGDRLFLLRQGTEPKGILAAGSATSTPDGGNNFTQKRNASWNIDVRFDVLLRPEDEILPLSALSSGKLSDVYWHPRASGMSVSPEAAAALEEIWTTHLRSLGLEPYRSADEIATGEKFCEGAMRRITINAYERDPRARAACISHYGSSCSICGFNFAEVFGAGTRCIHVHHLRPLAEIRKDYIVDPIADLRPVCPNCHAVIHSQFPALTIDKVKKLRRSSRVEGSY
jgi:5-methylcytosine-specific restriction enzyme A